MNDKIIYVALSLMTVAVIVALVTRRPNKAGKKVENTRQSEPLLDSIIEIFKSKNKDASGAVLSKEPQPGVSV